MATIRSASVMSIRARIVCSTGKRLRRRASFLLVPPTHLAAVPPEVPVVVSTPRNWTCPFTQALSVQSAPSLRLDTTLTPCSNEESLRVMSVPSSSSYHPAGATMRPSIPPEYPGRGAQPQQPEFIPGNPIPMPNIPPSLPPGVPLPTPPPEVTPIPPPGVPDPTPPPNIAPIIPPEVPIPDVPAPEIPSPPPDLVPEIPEIPQAPPEGPEIPETPNHPPGDLPEFIPKIPMPRSPPSMEPPLAPRAVMSAGFKKYY